MEESVLCGQSGGFVPITAPFVGYGFIACAGADESAWLQVWPIYVNKHRDEILSMGLSEEDVQTFNNALQLASPTFFTDVPQAAEKQSDRDAASGWYEPGYVEGRLIGSNRPGSSANGYTQLNILAPRGFLNSAEGRSLFLDDPYAFSVRVPPIQF